LILVKIFYLPRLAGVLMQGYRFQFFSLLVFCWAGLRYCSSNTGPYWALWTLAGGDPFSSNPVQCKQGLSREGCGAGRESQPALGPVAGRGSADHSVYFCTHQECAPPCVRATRTVVSLLLPLCSRHGTLTFKNKQWFGRSVHTCSLLTKGKGGGEDTQQ
jgi:hypothetical protein